MNTLRFPRASRTDCLRSPNPVQGPYHPITRVGHCAVAWLCLFGIIGVLGSLAIGWLA